MEASQRVQFVPKYEVVKQSVFLTIQLFFFSQTIINTQVNNNMQIIENIHNL